MFRCHLQLNFERRLVRSTFEKYDTHLCSRNRGMPKVHAFEACELVEKAVTAEAEDIKVEDILVDDFFCYDGERPFYP